MKTFTVVYSKEGKSGDFLSKFVCQHTDDDFIAHRTSEIYFAWGTKKIEEEVVRFDPNDYNIVTKPFEVEEEGVKKTINLKYLNGLKES